MCSLTTTNTLKTCLQDNFEETTSEINVSENDRMNSAIRITSILRVKITSIKAEF